MKAATVKEMMVSVIIPAYNEQDTIQKCLDSVAKQNYKNIEIIVIDDFSSDQTSAVVKQWTRKFKRKLRIVRNKRHEERGISRNLGARLSTGDYLLFIDADMQINNRVISDCIKEVRNNHAVKAIIIPEESLGEGFWAKCKSLEKQCYIGDNRVEAARFFEKKAFWKVGGWDNKMISGEDWDLTRRIRTYFKVSRVNSYIYHNEYHLTLWKTIKKKFYYASVSGIYLEKNPLSLLTIAFFIFRPSFIRNWKLIVADPLHGLGMFFLKAIELSAGGAGFLFSKLPNLL